MNKPEFPKKSVLSRLNVFALEKLEDIVRSRSISDQGQEYSQSELIAAKELLNRLSKINWVDTHGIGAAFYYLLLPNIICD